MRKFIDYVVQDRVYAFFFGLIFGQIVFLGYGIIDLLEKRYSK